MKRITLILLFIAGLTGAARTQTPLHDAQRADAAYREGDYLQAVEGYEAALQAGCEDADLHYNLGNAYYRTGQMGRAILHYKRALRLKPNMDDVRENLTLAESHTVDRIDAVPQLFVARWIDAVANLCTPRGWRVLVLVLVLLLAVVWLLYRHGRQRELRKWSLVASLLVALLLIVCIALGAHRTAHFNAHREAVVLAEAISVKASPEEQGTDKMILHEGTVVTISESLDTWYKIKLSDGNTGWCYQSEVERI